MNARQKAQLEAAAAALDATPYLNLYDAEGSRVIPDTRRLARLIRTALSAATKPAQPTLGGEQ